MTSNIGISLPEPHVKRIVWTLLCLNVVIGMGVDLIAPSLPAIAHGLHVPNSAAKNIIAIYLLGYALGNFFTGFLTDAWGRQKIIRLSLFSFVIVSLLPVFFQSMDIILLSRILQGITLGSFAVVARSVFSDVLPKEKLTRLGTLMGTMWGLGPVLGPVIGGYLQFYFGWTAGFYFFAIIAFIGFVASFIIIPETHFNRHPLKLNTIKTNLMEVISNRLFMCIVVLMGLAYSLVIVFNTVGPFLIQNEFHYSPVFFGHVALWLGVVFLISTLVCRYLLKKYSIETLYLYVIHGIFFITHIIYYG
ncbi:MAG: MFS transporter [Gammaproteobacteria bacterium]|nr:MFS transporter [Gammaproteobacteria bacterium]